MLLSPKFQFFFTFIAFLFNLFPKFKTSNQPSFYVSSQKKIGLCEANKNCLGSKEFPWPNMVWALKELTTMEFQFSDSEIELVLMEADNEITNSDFEQVGINLNDGAFTFLKGLIEEAAITIKPNYDEINSTNVFIKSRGFSIKIPSRLEIYGVTFLGEDTPISVTQRTTDIEFASLIMSTLSFPPLFIISESKSPRQVLFLNCNLLNFFKTLSFFSAFIEITVDVIFTMQFEKVSIVDSYFPKGIVYCSNAWSGKTNDNSPSSVFGLSNVKIKNYNPKKQFLNWNQQKISEKPLFGFIFVLYSVNFEVDSILITQSSRFLYMETAIFHFSNVSFTLSGTLEAPEQIFLYYMVGGNFQKVSFDQMSLYEIKSDGPGGAATENYFKDPNTGELNYLEDFSYCQAMITFRSNCFITMIDVNFNNIEMKNEKNFILSIILTITHNQIDMTSVYLSKIDSYQEFLGGMANLIHLRFNNSLSIMSSGFYTVMMGGNAINCVIFAEQKNNLNLSAVAFNQIYLQSLSYTDEITQQIYNFYLSPWDIFTKSILFQIRIMASIGLLNDNTLFSNMNQFFELLCSAASATFALIGNKIDITEANFDKSISDFKSGLFYLYKNNYIKVLKSSMSKIKSTVGSIYFALTKNKIEMIDSTVEVCDSYFTIGFLQNAGDSRGTFLFAIEENTIFISRSVINNITADQGAGFFIIRSNSLIVSFCNFSNISATNQGGILYAQESNVEIIFQSSRIEVASALSGACFYLEQFNELIIEMTKIVSTSAEYGGAMTTYRNNKVTVNKTTFNFLESKHDTGWIYCREENNILLSQIQFTYGNVGRGNFLSAISVNIIQIQNSDLQAFFEKSVLGFLLLIDRNILNVSLVKISKFNNNFLKAENLNIIYLNSVNFSSIQFIEIIYSDFTIGVLNNLTISNSEFKDHTGLQGIFLKALALNTIVFKQSYFNSFSVKEGGGVVLLDEEGNTLEFYQSKFTNFTAEEKVQGMLFQFSAKNSVYLEGIEIFGIFKFNLTQVPDAYNSMILVQGLSNNITINASILRFSSNNIEVNQMAFIFFLGSSIDSLLLLIDSNISITNLHSFAIVSSRSLINITDCRFYKSLLRKVMFYISENAFFFIKRSYFIDIHLKEAPFVIFYSNQATFQLQAVKVTNALKGTLVFLIKNTTIIAAKLKLHFCTKKVNPLEYYNFLLASEFSRVTISKAQILCLSTSNASIDNENFNYNIAIRDRSELYIKTSLIGFNEGTMSKGGVIFTTEEAIIKFSECIFLRNTGSKGGVFYLQGSNKFILNRNLFLLNNGQGFFNYETETYIPGKGGCFYITENVGPKPFPTHFMDNNYFWRNFADIGSVFFTEGLVLDESFYNQGNNQMRSNNARFYGKLLASDPVFLGMIPSFDYNFLPTKTINLENPILSNENYTNCLFYIVSYDNYSQMSPMGSKLSWTGNKLSAILSDEGSLNVSQQVELKISEFQSFLCIEALIDSEKEVRFSKSLIVSIALNDIILPLPMTIYDGSTALIFSLFLRKCKRGESFVADTKECKTCPPFSYSFKHDFAEPSECNSCLDTDFHCYGGFNLTAKPGFWRSDYKSTRFLKCPNHNACKGDELGPGDMINGAIVNPFDETLSGGSCAIGYSSELCTRCEGNYGQGDNYKCALCDDPMFYVVLAFKVVFKCFVYIYSFFQALILCKKLGSKGVDPSLVNRNFLIKILVMHSTSIASLANFPFNWPQQFSEFFNLSVNSVAPESQKVFTFECIFKKMTSRFNITYFKLLVALLFPIVVVLLVIVYLLLVKFFKKKRGELVSQSDVEDPTRRKSSYSLVTIVLKQMSFESVFLIGIMLSCPEIIKAFLEMFATINIGSEEEEDLRLMTDVSISYYSVTHQKWLKRFVIPSLVFLFIVPCYLLFKLVNAKNLGKLGHLKNVTKYGYFYLAYKKNYYFFDLVFFLRKCVLIYWDAFHIKSLVFSPKENHMLYGVIYMGIFGSLRIYHSFMKPFDKENFDLINKAEDYSLLTLTTTGYFALIWLNLNQNSGGEASPVTSKIFFVIGITVNCMFLFFWCHSFFKHGKILQSLQRAWRRIRRHPFVMRIFKIRIGSKETTIKSSNLLFGKDRAFIRSNARDNIERDTIFISNNQNDFADKDKASMDDLRLNMDRMNDTSSRNELENLKRENSDLLEKIKRLEKLILLSQIIKKENKKLRLKLQFFENEREEYERKWRKFEEDPIGEENTSLSKGFSEQENFIHKLSNFKISHKKYRQLSVDRDSQVDLNGADEGQKSFRHITFSNLDQEGGFSANQFLENDITESGRGNTIEGTERKQSVDEKSPEAEKGFVLVSIDKKLDGSKLSNYHLEAIVILKNVDRERESFTLRETRFLNNKSIVVYNSSKRENHKIVISKGEEISFILMIRYIGNLEKEFRPLVMKMITSGQKRKEGNQVFEEESEFNVALNFEIDDFLVREPITTDNLSSYITQTQIKTILTTEFLAKMETFKGFDYLINEDGVNFMQNNKEVHILKAIEVPSENLRFILILVKSKDESYFGLKQINLGKHENKESIANIVNYIASSKIQLLY